MTIDILLLTSLLGSGCRFVDPFEPIRARIRQELANGEVPSVAIAVARGNRILWEEAFGWADRENRVRATTDTIYTLGSTSKPFTATAVMLLRDRGLVDLDRPVNDYLGEVGLRARIGELSQTTVRKVAQHTAGLPGYYETFYADERDRPPPMNQVIRRYGQLTTPPGERFYYTNLDYVVLGSVIARVSGKTYAEFLKHKIFQPLGLSHADVSTTPGLDSYRATRYLRNGTRLPFYVTSCAPAADVALSVHDLIQFGMLHLKTPRPGRKLLLSARTIEEMQQSTVAMGTERYGIG